MKHDFEQLGDRRFQEFTQALLVKAFPDLSCLPVGMPDGGRDAVSRGSHATRKDARDLLIFQVKYCVDPTHLSDPEGWVRQAIEGERSKIEALTERGATHYFLVTNMPATSHLDRGSHDRVQAVLDELPLNAQCLWRADLDRRLEGAWDLKWAYPDLMTGTDLIRALAEGTLSEDSGRRSRAIRSFVTDQFNADREVRFKQAELHNELLDVFVDVPVGLPAPGDGTPSVLHRRIQELAHESRRGKTRLPPRPGYRASRPLVGAGTLLLDSRVQTAGAKVVVEGAPGQGKSTMVQYVCQVHRMRLLGKQDELQRLQKAHRVEHLRLPFKVDLREFAQWQEGISPFGDGTVPNSPHARSLESFLAASVSHHSGGARFDVDDLHAVVAATPALIALDGLDEVAEMDRRANLVEALSAAAERLDSLGVSVQIVVTTRPATFTSTSRFPARQFDYVKLTDITPELIEDYRDRWIAAHDLRKEDREEITSILHEKLDQPHFRDLARNPMQLAILLGLIHRKGPALPDRRTALYSSYMEIFLDREATKSTAVRNHRELLHLLHGYLAWRMHSAAERSPRDGGRITTDDLVATVEDFLESQGRPRELFDDLFGGVIDRFGALNSRLEGTLEFEVLPLREYFAASYLFVTAPYVPAGTSATGTLPERLDAMLKRPLWLNVTRFYAGFYSIGQLPSLVDRIAAFSEDPEWACTPTPRNTSLHVLSDRTLSKDIRALEKAVSLVAEGFGDRHAVNMDDAGFSGEGPIVLPEDGGAAELSTMMLERARLGPMSSSRLRPMALAIQANANESELTEIWLQEATTRSGEALDKWFLFGSHLEVLCRVDPAELSRLIGEQQISPDIVAACLNGNAPYAFDFSAAASERAADVILDGELYWISSDSRHPLVDLVTIAFCDLQALTRETHVFFGTNGWQGPSASENGCFNAIRELGIAYSRIAESPDVSWLSDMRPWDEIVEHARSLFGDRYAFDRVAIAASGIRDPIQRGGGHGDLFDESTSLVLRARSARHRGGDAAWWTARLTDPTATDRQRRLAVALLALWGDRRSLRSNLDLLTTLVDELDPGEFHKLSSAVIGARRVYDLSGDSERRANRIKSGDELPIQSARVFTLVGPRLPNAQRRTTYSKSQFPVSLVDVHVVHSMISEETRHLDRSATTWERMLGLLASAEATGASALRVTSRRRHEAPMPASVARRVVDAPNHFPLEIVTLAERTLERAAVAKAEPVGQFAEAQSWFGTQGAGS